jgi:hypothetical protein
MTRTKKVLVATAATLVLLGGAVAVLPPLLFGDRVDYSRVVSIEQAREYQDPALLARAFALPVAARYQAGLDYQANGSFCGPTSIVNVMRSLGRDADQKTVLDGTGKRTVLGMVVGGVTLDELAAIAEHRLGGRVTVLRDLDLASFRRELARANDPSVRLVANFSRGPLFGRGGGHHSPIAGYLVDEDLVLVLDVNRRYQPWLVRSARLLEAIDTFDRMAGKKRGLLRIE